MTIINIEGVASVFYLEKSPSAHKTTPLINYITTPFTTTYFANFSTLHYLLI